MNILTPASIGNAVLKNRILFPSMCNFYCDAEGFVTPQLKAFVRARAEGGAGAIIMPGSPHGKPSPARPALSDPKYYDGWRALRDICHEQNCRLFVQIHPAKAQAERDPSLLLPDHMPVQMIEEIVSSYAACARAAREIGLDGVEIHGAHAHEVAQFMSPYYNHRTDAYGGSVRNRARLGIEVVRAIKEAAGEDFPVIFRISSEERIPGGREIDETIEISRLLEQAGADALHVSTGMPLSEAFISAPMDVPDGFNLDQIARIHDAVHIPVIAVNRINTPELAESVVSRRIADFVAVGRGMLADPQFVLKAQTGEPIRQCLGCNQGCRKSPTKKEIYCVQNPFTGREASLRLTFDEALSRRRVLIAGAGIAGLEAALDLALRGAAVEVWEKSSRAGGLLELARIPPHKDVMERMVSYRVEQLRRLGVPIRFEQEATPENIGAFAPDLVIVATGSQPSVPPIPGLECAGVYTSDHALRLLSEGSFKHTGRCAILGGGLVGLEIADALCARGIQPEIFELTDAVGAGLNKNRLYFIKNRLEAGHCITHCGARVEKVAFPHVTYSAAGETHTNGPFDAVITALGRRSEHALADRLRETHPNIHTVCLGDANRVGTAMDAVLEAAQFAAQWDPENFTQPRQQ